MHGDRKRWKRGSFRKPWRRHRKQGVGGVTRKEEYSGNQEMGDAEQEVGMLGQ